MVKSNSKELNELLSNATRRLKDIRESSGLSQKDFAQKFGVNQTTYCRYENGDIETLPGSLIKEISEEYSVNPSWIAGFENVSKYVLTEEVNKESKKVPVIGTIAAGQPILASEDIQGYEYVVEDSGVDFCLRVKGDSMIGARIYNGDVVFIHQQPEVENGEIAAVIIDGEEATLKRVYSEPGRIRLHAENPTIPDKVFTLRDRKQVNIIGKVKYVKFEAR